MSDSFYDKALSSADQKVFVKLKERFFTAPKPVLQAIEDESQKIQSNGGVTLGCMAGPSMEVSNLIHEMSHFVEIDDARMNVYGWGLSYGKEITIPGHGTFHEPVTWQATQRELRVFAYQVNVHEKFSVKMSFKEIAETLHHVHDYYMVPSDRDKREPFLITRLKKLVAQPRYSFESFEKEWKRKLAILERKVA